MLTRPDLLQSLSGADLQKFVWLLDRMEACGATDIRTVRQLVGDASRQARMQTEGKMRRRASLAVRGKQSQYLRNVDSCPECGKKSLKSGVVEGLLVTICTKCGWSAYVDQEDMGR